MSIEPTLASFERTLTASDTKQNIPFRFQVPAEIAQLEIELNFSPWVVEGFKNLLTLTVLDPTGFRGAGHRHGDQHRISINADYASPGFCAGPIQAGEWTVIVDTHLIMPGPPCEMRLEVTGMDPLTQGKASALVPGSTRPRGRGWYRGDLHAHSIHSDAIWDIPDLVAWARARQLDFCTLSDHNTVSGLVQMDAARSDDLLTMGGMELTTFWGHALALGLREWVDWRTGGSERTMQQIASEVVARGGTFVIAHPASVGDPHCTGCRWVYESMRPGNAHLVEPWNGPWWRKSDKNEEALALVFEWLNQGHHLAFTAGTDNHGREPFDTPYGFNVVWAEELSEPEILRAIRAGHSYLSSGPHLELVASAGDNRGIMGDTLAAIPNDPIRITATWGNSTDFSEISLIVNGEPRETLHAGRGGSHTWELQSGDARWCLLTLRDADRTMLALTNPIYFDRFRR